MKQTKKNIILERNFILVSSHGQLLCLRAYLYRYRLKKFDRL